MSMLGSHENPQAQQHSAVDDWWGRLLAAIYRNDEKEEKADKGKSGAPSCIKSFP